MVNLTKTLCPFMRSVILIKGEGDQRLCLVGPKTSCDIQMLNVGFRAVRVMDDVASILNLALTDGLKMSKSLKNFITIRAALTMYSARQLRQGRVNYSPIGSTTSFE